MLEPIGRHLTIIPHRSPDEVHGIIIAKTIKIKCHKCRGKCLMMTKFGHLIECEHCSGSGELSETPPITRINYFADVVAVGSGVTRIRPGDTVAVSYWAGRTAAGSRILEKDQYGLPAGSLVCHQDEIVAVQI